MSRKGMLLVLSGPSGVGKDAVRMEFMARSANVRQSISATTRPMRPGEVHGVDYFFLQQEEFDAMIERGEFLEYVRYNQKSYGTPMAFVREMMDKGTDVLLKIDVNGAVNVKKAFPEAVLIFLLPPSMQELWNRLVGRGTGTKEDNLNRFRLAYGELEYYKEYDYLVVNDVLNEAVDRVTAIYNAEQMRREYSAEFCENLKKEHIEDEISRVE